MNRTHQDWVGVRLEDRFEVHRLLATGGMGSVFVAWDERFELSVAVKVLRAMVAAEDPTLEGRFLAEAQTLAHLKDPRIVRPISWGRAPSGELYIVTELLDGRSLDHEIVRNGPLDGERTARLLIDLCHALHEAHEAGIIHRDVKPSNVFVQRLRGGAEMGRLLDFGVAKVVSAETSSPALGTATGMIVGTPEYMAPEQARGQDIDGRTDLFCLGLVAYACLVGKRPFDQSGVAAMMANSVEPIPTFETRAPSLQIDPELQALVMRLLDKDPTVRPQSAAALRTELERWLALRWVPAVDALTPADPTRRTPPRSLREATEVSHDVAPGTELDTFGPLEVLRSRRRLWSWIVLPFGAGILAVATLTGARAVLRPAPDARAPAVVSTSTVPRSEAKPSPGPSKTNERPKPSAPRPVERSAAERRRSKAPLSRPARTPASTERTPAPPKVRVVSKAGFGSDGEQLRALQRAAQTCLEQQTPPTSTWALSVSAHASGRAADFMVKNGGEDANAWADCISKRGEARSLRSEALMGIIKLEVEP